MVDGVLDFNVPSITSGSYSLIINNTEEEKDFVIGGESYHFPKGHTLRLMVKIQGSV